MKSGPKAEITAGPLPMKGWPRRGGARVIRFIETYCVTPKGHGAGEPMRLRPWQKRIIRALYDPDPRPRSGLVSLPRGNGKSTLTAAIALYELFATGIESPQVLAVASDERQAGILLGIARRIIELSPPLAERCHLMADYIRIPATNGEMRALPSQAAALQGYDPSFAVVDELHVVTADVWEAVTLASGKRPESLTLAISTPSDSLDSVMWTLTLHGRRGDDPAFVYVEHAAPEGCAIDDERAWAQANPALHDFLSVDALRATLRTTRPSSFRRYRLGQWVGQEGAWMSRDLWETCATGEGIVDGESVCLFFDGSASGDSTALVAATVSETPHVAVVGYWANPGDPRWRVPRGEVMEAIDAAFERFDVVEFAFDPWGWRSEMETLEKRHGPRVVQWPTNVVSRMAPACDRFYAATAEGRLTHDGNADLAAHVTNCVAKSTPAGDVVVKDRRKGRAQLIDLAVAAIGAVDRAAWHDNTYQPRIGVIGL